MLKWTSKETDRVDKLNRCQRISFYYFLKSEYLGQVCTNGYKISYMIFNKKCYMHSIVTAVTHHLDHFDCCLLYQTCAKADYSQHAGKNPPLS